MIELDHATLKHILVEYSFDIPRYTWKEKEKVLFRLKAKYGNSFNTKAASKIYDQLRSEEEEPNQREDDDGVVDADIWEEPKMIEGD